MSKGIGKIRMKSECPDEPELDLWLPSASSDSPHYGRLAGDKPVNKAQGAVV